MGFINELGKNALTIDSRQLSEVNKDLPKAYGFLNVLLQSKHALGKKEKKQRRILKTSKISNYNLTNRDPSSIIVSV
jgi:hypothetical protein